MDDNIEEEEVVDEAIHEPDFECKLDPQPLSVHEASAATRRRRKKRSRRVCQGYEVFPPMQRSVSVRDKFSLQSTARPVMQALLDASQARDYNAMGQHMARLALVPRGILLLPSSPYEFSRESQNDPINAVSSDQQQHLQHHPHEHQQQHQSTHATSSYDNSIDNVVVNDDGGASDDEIQQDDTSSSSLERTINRVVSLLKRGHLGRAAKALFQRSAPRVDDEAIESLRSLHPQHTSDLPVNPPLQMMASSLTKTMYFD